MVTINTKNYLAEKLTLAKGVDKSRVVTSLNFVIKTADKLNGINLNISYFDKFIGNGNVKKLSYSHILQEYTYQIQAQEEEFIQKTSSKKWFGVGEQELEKIDESKLVYLLSGADVIDFKLVDGEEKKGDIEYWTKSSSNLLSSDDALNNAGNLKNVIIWNKYTGKFIKFLESPLHTTDLNYFTDLKKGHVVIDTRGLIGNKNVLWLYGGDNLTSGKWTEIENEDALIIFTSLRSMGISDVSQLLDEANLDTNYPNTPCAWHKLGTYVDVINYSEINNNHIFVKNPPTSGYKALIETEFFSMAQLEKFIENDFFLSDGTITGIFAHHGINKLAEIMTLVSENFKEETQISDVLDGLFSNFKIIYQTKEDGNNLYFDFRYLYDYDYLPKILVTKVLDTVSYTPSTLKIITVKYEDLQGNEKLVDFTDLTVSKFGREANISLNLKTEDSATITKIENFAEEFFKYNRLPIIDLVITGSYYDVFTIGDTIQMEDFVIQVQNYSVNIEEDLTTIRGALISDLP